MSSSRFSYNHICEHYKKPFEEQKVTIRFGSQHCRNHSHKQAAWLAIIAAAGQQAKRHMPAIQTSPEVLYQLKHKDFLSVWQAGKLLGCSQRAVYNLVSTGRLKATNLVTRKTTIKRSDIDSLFT